ncbi:MAG: hypothetical protein PHQ60_15775 [Sideroxydans sp.]|nr:hypothetical protein [Sideroxydans sp.]
MKAVGRRRALAFLATATCALAVTSRASGASLFLPAVHSGDKPPTPTRTPSPTATATLIPTPTATPLPSEEQLLNGNFEDGPIGWTQFDDPAQQYGFIRPGIGYEESWGAQFLGVDGGEQSIRQGVTLPAGTTATLTFRVLRTQYYANVGPETTLKVQVLDPGLTVLDTLLTLKAAMPAMKPWQLYEYDVSAYAGQAIVLKFNANRSGEQSVWFTVDEVSLKAHP